MPHLDISNFESMTAQERAFEKGRVLGEMRGVAKQQRHDYFKGSIEVIDIVQHSDFIVEIFARAWSPDGEQIGFGVDGSVDAERFMIYNPPAIIPNPAGEISKDRFVLNPATQKNKFIGVDHYQLDVEAALLEALSHVIKVKKQKFGPGNIEKGKIGSSTLVFHPDADPESTCIDGIVQVFSQNIRWNSAKSRTNGTSVGSTAATRSIVDNSVFDFAGNLDFTILLRSYFLFDTSSISPETEIISATLSIYSTGSGNIGLAGFFQANLVLLSSNPQSNIDLVLSDYSRTRFGSTPLAPILSIATFNASIEYHDFLLNTDGLSNLILGGVSKFGFRGESDYDDDPVNPFGAEITSGGSGYFADQLGSTQDPRLVIETLSIENALFYGGGL